MRTNNFLKMMFSALSVASFIFSIFAVSAQAAGGRIRVVTTTPVLKALAEFVGGDRVDVASIASGAQDPHFVDAKPSFIIKARQADLFIRIGLDLELAWEALLVDESRNPKIKIGSPGHLDACEGIAPLEVPAGAIDRSMGDIHPYGNPHYWLDPENAKIMADNIARRLALLSPENSAYFTENAVRFSRLIDEKMREWQARMAPFKGEKVITYHKSWPYFARRFGLVVAAELEPKPGIPPTSRHLLGLVKKIGEEHIDVILMEPYYSDKAAKFLASRAPVRIVKAANSVGGAKGLDDYFLLIDNAIDELAAAFEVAKAQ